MHFCTSRPLEDLKSVNHQKSNLKNSFFLLFSGNFVLHPTMALEKLGGRKNSGPHHGPGPGDHLWGREAPEEETAAGLPLLQPEEPQLLGLPILLLWTPFAHQCHRSVWTINTFFLHINYFNICQCSALNVLTVFCLQLKGHGI